MIQFPRYLPEQNALAVPEISTPFPAGSLVAVRQGDMLAIASPVDGTLICRWAAFDAWVMADGTVFKNADAAFAALDAACRQKRAVGNIFDAPAVVGEDIAVGMPVAVSRGDGTLRLARADTYPLAFVTGLAAAACARGFTTAPTRGAVTLSDWTEQTGRATLFQGAPYFLAPSGGMTVSPFLSVGMTSTQIGVAASSTTLVVAPSSPILL